MMNSPLFYMQHARPNLRLVCVHRNEVPTVVAFRTVLQAQRARQVMWNETWQYDAWGQVIMMMPLKGLVKHQSGGMVIWKATPHAILRRGINKFGVDVCEIDTDNILRVTQAIFVHKQLDIDVMSQHLQTSFKLL
jgi:hypothetical protein